MLFVINLVGFRAAINFLPFGPVHRYLDPCAIDDCYVLALHIVTLRWFLRAVNFVKELDLQAVPTRDAVPTVLARHSALIQVA